MALKQKITKAEHEKLSADLQKEYKASGDDFILDVEGYDDPAELRRARDREKQAAADAKKKSEDLQAELDRLSGMSEEERRKALKGNKDIDALEASWKTQRETEVAAERAKTQKREAALQKRLVDDTATNLARELAGDSFELLLPHVKTRLSADLEADEPTTRVLDAAGQLSALTVEQLATEFRTNPKFSAIVIGSKGSGGGAPGGRQSPAGGGDKKFADMNGAERTALFKSDPARFERESKAAQSSGPIL